MTAGEFDIGDFSDFDASDFAPDVPRQEPRTKAKPPLEKSDPFPLEDVDLLAPPGFVGDVARWVDSQCRYPRQRLAVASALLAVGNIGGLRHEDAHDGVTANMLAFCVAASATGKEAVQQAMAQLHIAAGISAASQGSIKSEQEIMRNLIEHQAAYYVVDEIGIFLGKVRNAQKRGTAAYLEGVFGAIMSAYSKANSRLFLGGDVKRDLRKQFGAMLAKAADDGDEALVTRAERMLAMVDKGLERPFLSVMGYTTPSTFDGVMDGETATQGFVGRALIVTEQDINPAARRGFKAKPLPENIATRLAALYCGGVFDMTARANARVEYAGDRVLVPTSPDAAALLEKVADWLHEYADEMGENTGEASVAMIRRAYEMVAKVSFILAIPHGTRTADHVRWAFAYCRAELDAKIALVFANDNRTDRPEESLAARILNYLSGDGGLSLKVISNRMKIKPEALEPVLRKMEAAGMVREQHGKRRVKGEILKVWVKP